jgi:hypothetical protein
MFYVAREEEEEKMREKKKCVDDILGHIHTP